MDGVNRKKLDQKGSAPFPFLKRCFACSKVQSCRHGIVVVQPGTGCGICHASSTLIAFQADATGCCVLCEGVSRHRSLSSFCCNGATCPVVGTYTATLHIPIQKHFARPPSPFILFHLSRKKNDRLRPLKWSCLPAFLFFIFFFSSTFSTDQSCMQMQLYKVKT